MLWGKKKGPNATFNLYFWSVGLALGGEFVGFTSIFTCFPTRPNLVNRKHPIQKHSTVSWNSVTDTYLVRTRRVCTTASTSTPVLQYQRQHRDGDTVRKHCRVVARNIRNMAPWCDAATRQAYNEVVERAMKQGRQRVKGILTSNQPPSESP